MFFSAPPFVQNCLTIDYRIDYEVVVVAAVVVVAVAVAVYHFLF